MRGTALIVSCAAAACALAGALSIAGCNSSAAGVPLPGPSLAPTQCPGCFSEYAIPSANATPIGIALGSDNNLWFTEYNANKIGSVTPAGAITEYPLNVVANPVDIIAGPNNSLWFTEPTTSEIGEISTTGTIHQFNTLSGSAAPLGIAVDPTSTNRMWFGESNLGKIGSLTAGGAMNEYANGLSTSSPVAVAVTADGTVWYLDDGRNTLGELTFPGGAPTFADFGMPTDGNGNVVSGLGDIVVGPDGNVWFTATTTDDVCQAIVSVSPPTINCAIPPSDVAVNTMPFGIVSDPSRSELWFAEIAAGQIASISTAGSITEYGINGSGTTAIDVAMGPDAVGGSNSADVWFTNGGLFSLQGLGTNDIGQAHLAQFGAKPLAKTYAQFKSHARFVKADKRSLVKTGGAHR